ncbi:hypothetical protein Zmor_013091 [Zophobas morio]|uniref:phosphatidate cytidylyltransferase n=1 Tax=Zophobas morio TaxID=2755281 RepID=A0AA38ID88_9CUCU|nr:hypothetical protein Zmor_013091 [Zophobas morio]
MNVPAGPRNVNPHRPFFHYLSNVIKRIIFGIVMASSWFFIIYLGPFMLILTVLAIQVSCFREILNVGYNCNRVPPSLPFFRSLCCYFLVAANYFLSIETIAPHFDDIYKNYPHLEIVIKYNRFISFCIYFIGIVLFVVNLVRKHDLQQFKILAWTHTLLIIIVLQSYLVIANMFNGIIWLILPSSLVILNDIFAYMFGRLWGRTPLIQLSPRKTWEGFVGGIVGTFLSGYLLSNYMCQYQYFVCPVEYYQTGGGIKMMSECTLGYLFTPTTYSLGVVSINFYPFTYHFFWMALFASVVAPFGGFCASGFKRAFKMKHFGEVIPGHGGITDRFDCQFLMATFVNVYIFTFVGNPSVGVIFDKVLGLDEGRQVEFYYLLKDMLQDSYLLNSTDVS